MAITDDFDTLFVGQYTRGNQGVLAIYGVTEGGTVKKVFDPYETLPSDAYGGSPVTGAAAVVGGSLVLPVLYLRDTGGRVEVDTHVLRISPQGVIETLAVFPLSTVGGFGFGASDSRDTGIAAGGSYAFNLGPSGNAFRSTDTILISPDGQVSTGINFVRDRLNEGYEGATAGLAMVGQTLFAIGNEQTPAGTTELWRAGPDGQKSLAFFDATLSITDLESFSGKAWFITAPPINGASASVLRSVGETGRSTQVGVGRNENVAFLDIDAGGLLAVTRGKDDSRGNRIISLAADGTFTVVLDDPDINEIVDIVGFDGQIYFVAETTTEPGYQLFRVGGTGLAVDVPIFRNGTTVGEANLDKVVVSGGSLWFTANMRVPDGFGGITLESGYFRLDADGTVTPIASLPRRYEGIEVITTLPFGIDVPDPIVGTADPDNLRGTERGDLISGLGGNDTLAGLGGDDSVSGGGGADIARGGIGDDTISGGDGNDTLDGGAGDDVLQGNAGRDRLVGGTGNDTLTGGIGPDIFVFGPGAGADRITDFADNSDTLVLLPALWGGGLTVAQVLATFGSIAGQTVTLDFGAEEIRIVGVQAIADLADDIAFA